MPLYWLCVIVDHGCFQQQISRSSQGSYRPCFELAALSVAAWDSQPWTLLHCNSGGWRDKEPSWDMHAASCVSATHACPCT